MEDPAFGRAARAHEAAVHAGLVRLQEKRPAGEMDFLFAAKHLQKKCVSRVHSRKKTYANSINIVTNMPI